MLRDGDITGLWKMFFTMIIKMFIIIIFKFFFNALNSVIPKIIFTII